MALDRRRETYLGMQCRMHELRNKERISVAAASKILANIVYEYKGRGLSMVSSGCAGMGSIGLADNRAFGLDGLRER